MKRAIAIALAVGLVAVAIPASAHQETNEDACRDKHNNECQPSSDRHIWCSGIRDWRGYVDDGSLSILDVTLSQSDTYMGVYVHVPTDGDSTEDDNGGLPGILWLEFNGFSGLQKSDWSCMNVGGQEDTVHSDTVLI